MVKLGTDKNLRQQMSIKARLQVEESFSWDKHINKWEELYKQLLLEELNNDLP